MLLSYWIGERSFLWVVTPESTRVHELPPARELANKVERYQASLLRSRDPLADGESLGSDLYRTLVAPAASAITPGSRVVLVADGPLNQLSFDTLVVPSPRPHYWLEDVVTLRTPSLSLLAGTPPTRPAPSLLAVGDPVQTNDAFPTLANAAREIESVTRHYAKGASTLSGAGATPAAFRSADLARFGIIHFAAHAASNRDRPLESAVVLSPHDGEYKLYACDILDLPIRAELVTLSTCRGAGSGSYRGEGLVGFAWAFLLAGARHVVAGLWDVEDASTAQLMDVMYKGLADGLPPPEALRNARLTLLKSPGASRKPYYWGPFVVFAQQLANSPVRAPRQSHDRP